MRLFDLSAQRPYVHCGDFAEALLAGLNLPVNQLINVVSANTTKRALVEIVEGITGSAFPAELEDKQDIRNYFVRAERATELGIRYSRDLPQGINEMLRHYTTDSRQKP
jgi:nucleoside-diphosphate-sugar epimerase